MDVLLRIHKGRLKATLKIENEGCIVNENNNLKNAQDYRFQVDNMR
jgi:hypothetical protein